MVSVHDHQLDPDDLELRRMFNEWDPIGVFLGDPEEEDEQLHDEYDCQIPPLMASLKAGHAAARIADSLKLQLKNHFGLDPTPSASHAFAEQIVQWWQTQRRHRSDGQ
jgi:hypothetical protein